MIKDRCRGCFLGLAIGDALGAPIEHKQPGKFTPITRYTFNSFLAPGEFTDDTSMALALADSIGSVGWDLEDQISRYRDWFKNGKYSSKGYCFDIGTITLCALNGKIESNEGSSGNGSIMRLAPVVIKYYDSPDLGKLAEESSSVTHPSWQCRSACRYMAHIISGLIKGKEREEVLSRDYIEGIELEPTIKTVALGSYRSKCKAFKGSGWVVECLEAALWAFHESKDFEEAVLRAVNLGDDSDTTGAVCGQMAGAYWGESGIPDYLKSGLSHKAMIEKYLSPILKD